MNNLWMLFIALAWAGCGQNGTGKSVDPQFTTKAPESGKEYVFAIHLSRNAVRLFEIYSLVIDYINRSIRYMSGSFSGSVDSRGV